MTYSASGNPLDPTDNVEEIYWDETHHSTGYPHLDRQHKEIITLYNQLVGSCYGAFTTRASCLITLLKLVKVMTAHFDAEERLFFQGGDRELFEYEVREHERFIDKVNLFIMDKHAPLVIVTTVIHDWLVEHLPAEVERFREMS